MKGYRGLSRIWGWVDMLKPGKPFWNDKNYISYSDVAVSFMHEIRKKTTAEGEPDRIFHTGEH